MTNPNAMRNYRHSNARTIREISQKTKDSFHKRIFYCISGCWLWTGVTIATGYGQLYVYDDKKLYLAHRLSFSIYKGLIPNKMFVCHSCDNPLCVNPDHLFLGSQSTNMADKVKKSRQCKGELNHSKLDNLQVTAIRECRKIGITQTELGRYFKVSPTLISAIDTKRIWKHI